MAPTGQTVAAVLLALGLVRGPADAQPPTSIESTDTSVAPDDTVEPESGNEPAEAQPEVEAEPVADRSPEDTAPADAAPEAETAPAAEAGAAPDAEAEAVDEMAPPPASEAPATDPDAEESDEGWEDESWEDEEQGWEDDYDPLRDSPEAVTSSRRIAGGAVVLGLGAMVSFGGLAMVLSDPCARPAGNSCSPASRNRAALTMALPGLAAVAVGSAMLALGLRQRKTLRLDANLTSSGGGVSFRGRF